MNSRFLIAGLGNIGEQYSQTRHNIGFMILDHLAKKHTLLFNLDKYAYTAEFKLKGRTILLIKPTTYMNLSGKAIQYWLTKEKIPVQNSLTVTDDLSLPFGKIRIKKKGSAGGHNGLTNIEQVLGSQDYNRMRIGIGSNFPKGRQLEYVLGKFNLEESQKLDLLLENSINGIESFILDGADIAMNKFNTLSL